MTEGTTLNTDCETRTVLEKQDKVLRSYCAQKGGRGASWPGGTGATAKAGNMFALTCVVHQVVMLDVYSGGLSEEGK